MSEEDDRRTILAVPDIKDRSPNTNSGNRCLDLVALRGQQARKKPKDPPG